MTARSRVFLWLMAAVGVVCAEEMHSNGLGGGRWSDPAAWRQKRLPAPDDPVVIAAGDRIVFDVADDAAVHCRGLFIDPKGALVWLAEEGRKRTLRVAGPIESYGAIRLDVERVTGAELGLELVANNAEERAIRLREGSALVMAGSKAASDVPCVVLASMPPAESERAAPATVTTGPGVTLDIRFTRVRDVVVRAEGLDNTGFKANERASFVGNRFEGMARLELVNCDTPSIQRNTFETRLDETNTVAITLTGCKLVDARDNRILGRYQTGLSIQQDVDAAVSATVISNCQVGIAWQGQNAMLKGVTLAACERPARFSGLSGVLQDLAVAGGLLPIEAGNSTLQFTDARWEACATSAPALYLNASSATLLNTTLKAEDVAVGPNPPAGDWVWAMYYLVARIKGAVPPGSVVDLRTAAVSGGPPPGRADLNVRNSPAPIRGADGLTPLPATQRALVVRAWAIGGDGKTQEAPFYELNIMAPGTEGQPPRVLKSQVIQPSADWYRAEPDAPTAALEVAL